MIKRTKIISLLTSVSMIAISVFAPCMNAFADDSEAPKYVEIVENSMWNIDFENHRFNINPDYPEYRYLADDTGNVLSATYLGVQSTLTAHTGTTANEITITDSGDSDHGKAVNIIVNNGNQVQFNEFRSRLSGGIVKIEHEMKFDAFPAETSNQTITLINAELAPDASGSSEYHQGWIDLKYIDGIAHICTETDEGAVTVKEAQTGVWYKLAIYIDFDNSTCEMYVDGESAGKRTFDPSYTWFEKMRVFFSNGAGARAWVDNFKAEKIRIEEYVSGVTITCPQGHLSLPEGTIVDVNVITENVFGIDKIELVSQEGNIIDTIYGESGTFAAALPKYPTIYTAIAYDSDGNILAESDSMELCGNPVESQTYIWDMGFEDVEFAPINPEIPEWRYVNDMSGNKLTSSVGGAQSALTAHTGTTSNDLTIEETGDDEHQRAIKFTMIDNAQVQFNEFAARTDSPYVLAQQDIFFETLPQNASNLSVTLMNAELAPDATGQNEKGVTTLLLKYRNGVPNFCYMTEDAEYYIGEVQANRWYNIKIYTDASTGLATLLLDDKFVFQSSFDTSLIWTEKYRTSFANAPGTVAWVDNFKVSMLDMKIVPKILSVTNDENNLYVEFAQPIDEDVFLKNDGSVRNIKATFGENILGFTDVESGDSPTILKFATDKEVFTAVPIEISVTVPFIGTDSITRTFIHTAAPSDFEVTDVNASYDGENYDITATFINTSGTDKTAVMIATFYDSDKNTVAVRVSGVTEVPNSEDETEVSISGMVEADSMKIFFIDNWTSAKAIKNITYKY